MSEVSVYESPSAIAKSLFAISIALDSSPIEEGKLHKAEDLLRDHIRLHGETLIADTVRSARSSLAADWVQLLGRLEVSQELKNCLVEWGLGSSDVGIRDSVVQAIENWEACEFIELLSMHKEPVAWLDYYVQLVLRNLSGVQR